MGIVRNVTRPDWPSLRMTIEYGSPGSSSRSDLIRSDDVLNGVPSTAITSSPGLSPQEGLSTLITSTPPSPSAASHPGSLAEVGVVSERYILVPAYRNWIAKNNPPRTTVKRLPIAFSSNVQRVTFLTCKWPNALTFQRFRKPSKPLALTAGCSTAFAIATRS